MNQKKIYTTEESLNSRHHQEPTTRALKVNLISHRRMQILRLAGICACFFKKGCVTRTRPVMHCTLSTDIFIDTMQMASVCSVANECSTEGARGLAECDQTTVKFSANQQQRRFAQLCA